VVKQDVLIIGGGPAGLFAAQILQNNGFKTTVLERGTSPQKRTSLNYGIGGAGAFSDGKLNLTPVIGGTPSSFDRTPQEIQTYIDRVDETFSRYSGSAEYSGVSANALQSLKQKAGKYGVEFLGGKQRHFGTTRIRKIIDQFYKELKSQGINFALETPVQTIGTGDHGFIAQTENEEYSAPYILAAPGRSGAYWLREVARSLDIAFDYGPIDVGIRVEFPAEIYDPIESIMYDAKFRLRSRTYDDLVRTFCTNPRGYVITEEYDGFALVNGHAENQRKSQCTNFALLSRVELTDPVEDTTQYGRSIASLANTIGGGKPILQRYKDLQQGRRSSEARIRRASVAPTMSNYTPGDISMALPDRILTNLLDGLDQLNQIIEGLTGNNTLLYAPEIKFYDTRYNVNKHLETSLPGFYVAGDASGHSRGIVYAAITGMLAAEDIRDKLTPS